MNLFNKLYQIFLSEYAKKRIEKVTLYVALTGFFIHLILIYLSKLGMINFLTESELFKNPISAIYTPFSFILVYEVYLLIYYLPKSFTTYITKQYEIITSFIYKNILELNKYFINKHRTYKKYYDQLQLPNKQQGRNEKCNCGSGLKYKKCCFNKQGK